MEGLGRALWARVGGSAWSEAFGDERSEQGHLQGSSWERCFLKIASTTNSGK